MSFISAAFLIFLPLCLLLRIWLEVVRRNRRAFLFAVILLSLVFYGWNHPPHLALLLLVTGLDFNLAHALQRLEARPRLRKAVFVAAIIANLGMLATFKYFNFFSASLGFKTALDLVLPLGISFYTFESISYMVDVYQRRIQPVRSIWKYLLFISFFPHLVAGPIVRAKEFIYQIDRRRTPNSRAILGGLTLLIRGLFLKIVIADNLAQIVNDHWVHVSRPGVHPWVVFQVVFAFSLQIYCDFDGYTTMARGIALLLGFSLPPNFLWPYVAATFKEFWERWHITLSRWLRDYLYVPLGGNRHGPSRTMINLFIVMLLGGLWHGANSTFVVWGAIHGAALAIERALGMHRADSSLTHRLLWFVVVQLTVIIAWVFFRAQSVQEAGIVVSNLFGMHEPGSHSLTPIQKQRLPWLILPVVLGHAGRKWLELRGTADLLVPRSKWLVVCSSALMLYFILTAYGKTTQFIYFQF